TGSTLTAELRRATESTRPSPQVQWPDDVSVPEDVEPVAQSVLAEALRNVAKHAQPTRIEVVVSSDADTFALEIRNDGVTSTTPGAGMGLRLAAFEALQHGGMVEFGAVAPDSWRVRLVVPIAEEARA
ncbi:MAG: hypothetical protein ACR2NR_16900, partial [Solirubrobacteraceae bacterium]